MPVKFREYLRGALVFCAAVMNGGDSLADLLIPSLVDRWIKEDLLSRKRPEGLVQA
jgi:hypothetical protein